ncbi:VanZ family protein [Bacillus sp. M6-12]|uniref:VanZ family protein n=1 Tax=Bacillus sp. M6-12 TaxID=2054166 RepID=UPI00115B9685|nr:VanZ family protein [Bacillus sp. M6-12]
MKIKNKIMLFIPLILWALLIFYFSSQTYKEQDITHIIDRYSRIINWNEIFGWVHFSYHGSEISIENKGVAHFIEFFIRKAAHFIIFFVLGFLTIRIWTKFTSRRLISFIGTLVFVVMYALLDEVHQKFTGGRTPLLADVWLDSVGGIFGVIAYYVVSFYRKRRRK